MNTRKLTSSLTLLAALSFAAAAHAGAYSMDAGTASGPGPGAASGQHDCTPTSSQTADAGHGVAGVRDSLNTSTSAATDRTTTAVAGTARGESTPGGSNTSSEAIGVPIKARSNRWQSLVPGAIK